MNDDQMNPSEVLKQMFECMPIRQLRQHLRQLREVGAAKHQYQVGNIVVVSTSELALALAGAVLESRELLSRSRASIVNDLRQAATQMGEAIPGVALTLADWVGVHNPAWYAVFSYSSPEPYSRRSDGFVTWEPWFCSLDLEAQRLLLLLVAEELETENST